MPRAISDMIFSKKVSRFEIAALFHHLYSKEKSAANSKSETFLTELSFSYIALALL